MFIYYMDITTISTRFFVINLIQASIFMFILYFEYGFNISNTQLMKILLQFMYLFISLKSTLITEINTYYCYSSLLQNKRKLSYDKTTPPNYINNIMKYKIFIPGAHYLTRGKKINNKSFQFLVFSHSTPVRSQLISKISKWVTQ